MLESFYSQDRENRDIVFAVISVAQFKSPRGQECHIQSTYPVRHISTHTQTHYVHRMRKTLLSPGDLNSATEMSALRSACDG